MFTGPQKGLGLLFGLAVPPLDTAEAFAGVANDSALFIPVLSQNSTLLTGLASAINPSVCIFVKIS